MNFESTVDRPTYFSLKQVLNEDYNRGQLYNKNKEFLYSLQEKLFDEYDVEGIYIINEFFEKFSFINKIPILFEVDKFNFEEMQDEKFNLLNNDNIDYYIKTENLIYLYSKGILIEENVKIKKLWKIE